VEGANVEIHNNRVVFHPSLALLVWPNVSRQPRPVGGVKGHNMNETSFAPLLLATACPGIPAVPAPF